MMNSVLRKYVLSVCHVIQCYPPPPTPPHTLRKMKQALPPPPPISVRIAKCARVGSLPLDECNFFTIVVTLF